MAAAILRNNNTRATPMFSFAASDPEMVEVPRSNAFDFIMKNLERIHRNHTNDLEERPYVFGGFVRDNLLGVEPTDMDIFAKRIVIKDFIEFLQASERLVSYRRNVTDITSNERDYFCFKIKVEVPGTHQVVSIDLVTDQQTDVNARSRHVPVPFKSKKDCDFTCNNLIMFHDGTLSSRVQIPGQSTAQTTLICVRDAINKTLRNMYSLPDIPPVPASFVHLVQEIRMNSYQKYLSRTLKMQSKGFAFLDEGDPSHIVPIPEFTMPVNASTLLEEGQEPSALMCAICRSDYDEESIQHTVVCQCGHHYHCACIQQWQHSGRTNGTRCPTCRAALEYRFPEPASA